MRWATLITLSVFWDSQYFYWSGNPRIYTPPPTHSDVGQCCCSVQVSYIWTLLNIFDLKDLKDACMNNRFRLKPAFNCDNEINLVIRIPHVKWETRRIDISVPNKTQSWLINLSLQSQMRCDFQALFFVFTCFLFSCKGSRDTSPEHSGELTDYSQLTQRRVLV